ncbi:HSP70-domain-containing protein [Dichomitus squalens]|uniref:HSP70-domain-containing protein n=1 Tax=Dichomitus squalens TaxID=114155 RepID=A0A4Q9MBH8_9APHY|nr:HSP70-domain-containing protein [Dichomitus squalens]
MPTRAHGDESAREPDPTQSLRLAFHELPMDVNAPGASALHAKGGLSATTGPTSSVLLSPDSSALAQEGFEMRSQPVPASETTAPAMVVAGPEAVPADDEIELKIIPPVIGIDLGTTYSCASAKRGERVEIIPNAQGQRSTPSWVSFTADERLVGDSAKNAYQSNPQNTVFDVKRLIGRDFDDPELQKDLKYWPFKVVQEDGKLKIQVQDCGVVRNFTPEEIAAMVLRKMKRDAESFLGQQVVQAVITVPAHFNDAQRQATKDAGAIAGLQVIRIINEPTAAAIAYSLNKRGEPSRVLVYRLGGGTFDVSLISIKDGDSKVLATAGDTKIGGEDFDNRVLDYLVKQHRSRTGIDVSSNLRTLGKLRSEVEKAKRTLSSQQSTNIDIEALEGEHGFSETLTRAKFEELNMDLFRRTMLLTEQVLIDAKLRKEDVGDIIMVGGSTHIPKVQQLLKNYFGKEPSTIMNPEEAAAFGTGVQGAILAGDDDYSTLAVLDVNSLTLGVEVVGDVMSPIIPRNTPIPTCMSKIYTTFADWQTSVVIRVFEGEEPLTRYNHLLGMFPLSGIPPARRGVPKIDVTFRLDVNGIMKVTAVDKGTSMLKSINRGNSKSITISNVLKHARS